MPKNIVLCSDGTGNSDIKGRGTNVFKLFEAVDLNDHRMNLSLDTQLAFYDDGVGTKGNALVRLIGGAAGYGLKRNVKELYRELSRVYDEGDRIYLFGFSRGAFTVRTLAGMIGVCGVLKGETFRTARSLRKAVDEGYNVYRSRYHSVLTNAIGTALGWPDGESATKAFQEEYNPHTRVAIEFIGVWDTVDAVGLPFALSGIVNSLVYQFKFPTQQLGRSVKRACHALSIDDPRLAFEPVLWQGDDPRIEQVWFAGVHSNVGGGYPKQGMSLVALDWMLAHAEWCGLRLQKTDRELFRGHATVDDLLYDPRSGLGLFYRWGPRDIRRYCERSRIGPRVHLSVTERIAHATDDYGPGNIPPGTTVAVTPLDVGDPERNEKERVLGLRARAVERALQDALGSEYLLDRVTLGVRLGVASYWVYISAWALVLLAVVSVSANVINGRQDVSEASAALSGAALLGFALACLLSRSADGAISDMFSQFWQTHQGALRTALKQSKLDARHERDPSH